MTDRVLSQTSIPPPSNLPTDIQWIADLRHRIWETNYRSYSMQAAKEGLRERRKRLTHEDLESVIAIAANRNLRVELIAPDGPQVKLFLPEQVGEEILRISWWHVPASMDDVRLRRRIAWKIFRRMAGLDE